MPSDLEDRIRRGQYEDIYRSRVQASTRDPRAMTPDEIVEEVTGLRETIHLAAQRVIELTHTLGQSARRHVAAEHTSAYVVYANAWGRLAGAVQHGLRRVQSMDRIVERAQKAQRDEYFQRAPPPPRPPRQGKGEAADPLSSRQKVFTGSPLGGQSMNDLMDLYGQEIVRDAVRR